MASNPPQQPPKPGPQPRRDLDVDRVAGMNPLHVPVGSEAAVAEGTGPVEAPGGNALAEATKIHNKDILERHNKELERRGQVGAGSGKYAISISFEGPMMIQVDGEEAHMRSGSFSGAFNESISLRPLTKKEQEELLPRPTRPARRAEDLVKGSGAGGGGNPMAAGQSRGVSSGAGPSTPGKAPTSLATGQGQGTSTKTGG